MDVLDRLAFKKWNEPDRIKVSLDDQLIGSLLWCGKAPDGAYAPDEFQANERRLRWFWRGAWSLKWTRAAPQNRPGPKP